MAQKPRKLTLRLSRNAERSLLEIWRWNAKTYSERHADAYIQFLMKRASTLETAYLDGQQAPTNPAYCYMTFRRRARGHGHVIVYQVRETEIYLIDFFHTAQDWQAKVEEE